MKEEMIQQMLAHYQKIQKPGQKGSQEDITACLREIQSLLGYIPADLQQKVADVFEVKLCAIQAYIKLYPSLKGQSFRHSVTVCTGPRCTNKGSKELLEQLKRYPPIKNGEIELRTQNCMHHCVTSPNVRIDGELVSNSNFEEIVGFLK